MLVSIETVAPRTTPITPTTRLMTKRLLVIFMSINPLKWRMPCCLASIFLKNWLSSEESFISVPSFKSAVNSFSVLFFELQPRALSRKMYGSVNLSAIIYILQIAFIKGFCVLVRTLIDSIDMAKTLVNKTFWRLLASFGGFRLNNEGILAEQVSTCSCF